MPILPWQQPQQIQHTQRLLDSFRHWLGRDLIPRTGTPQKQSRTLFEAPFVVVSHDTSPDPILTYGNAAALKLWEMDWETLIETPSRLTAEPVERETRHELLQRTARDGYVDDYSGIRISSTGRRFDIGRATVWNLIDESGNYAGQAATFSEWDFLEE